jgi:hypothetical protein
MCSRGRNNIVQYSEGSCEAEGVEKGAACVDGMISAIPTLVRMGINMDRCGMIVAILWNCPGANETTGAADIMNSVVLTDVLINQVAKHPKSRCELIS